MKRPLTLIGFILGTVMHSIYTVAELFLIALIIDLIKLIVANQLILFEQFHYKYTVLFYP